MLKPLVLHLGSNLGNKLEMLNSACSLLKTYFGKPVKQSAIYQTAAWGNINQADFLNMAVKYLSDKNPIEILKIVKQIEKKLGRKERTHWDEREIDIDIIFYGDEVINEKKLIIPHQMLHLRRFVLVPLNDIDSNYNHPVLHKTISELLAICNDKLEVKLWNS